MKRILLITAVMIVSLCSACNQKSENKADTAETNFTSKADETVLTINDDTKIHLKKISAGSFKMGSLEGIGDEDELPVRDITITQDFYIGVYEITQAQWEAVMGSNPSSFKGENLPVETVSWDDCNEFCEKLSKLTGKNVSLPTEAQWEYACRAGTDTKWFFGDGTTEYKNYANEDMDAKTYEVGSFQPNQNGLFDLYGNVMEWCLDYYSINYDENDTTDPTGSETGDSRITRGGGWGESSDNCRSGYRNAVGADIANDGIGLRIVIIE